MFKLVLEKAEKQEIKLPTSAGSSKKQERPNGHEFEWTLGVGDGQGRPGVLRFMGSERVRHN